MNMNDAQHLRWIAALGAAFFACGASAAELTSPPVAPVAEDMATGLSPWQIRLRALGVITKDSGSINGVSASDLSYSDSLIPELDISYFFTDNIAAELILGTTYANIKEDGAVNVPVGRTWLLPPTLTLQYHFTDFGSFKPYVGAGINYSLFYNQSEKPGFHNLHVDNHVGAALQVGFDYMVDEHWGLNFDMKKIFLETDWKADHDVLGPLSGKAKIDPLLIGAGVTYRF
ncbi:OmpW/AlkL family protein [Sinorhizobium psoraleae]|uniref:OmpW family protein n=1 Tax=Sinorhizobium psoraleae TaxID=520838 RepID=A0ABT4KNS8_9HYPH|nr:OmpW family protein [Sinorhizobium psoraleae]MCZ4093603.1 OmpW family protein [Sinorhizobium psoraleae]